MYYILLTQYDRPASFGDLRSRTVGSPQDLGNALKLSLFEGDVTALVETDAVPTYTRQLA